MLRDKNKIINEYRIIMLLDKAKINQIKILLQNDMFFYEQNDLIHY
jgi:hypothetical protein